MRKEILSMKNPSSVRLMQVIATLIVLCAACAASSQQMIYTFPSNGLSGGNPMGGLIRDAAGNLYGTTRDGGASSKGTVFKLSLQGGVWKETVLYSFKGYNYKDGSLPVAALVFDKAGNLYGTTGNGGTADRGTAFQLSPAGNGGWTETVLHSFYGAIGTYPQPVLPIDSAGSLYGTTIAGGDSSCILNNGSGCGTVFRLKKKPNRHMERESSSQLFRPARWGGCGRGIGLRQRRQSLRQHHSRWQQQCRCCLQAGSCGNNVDV